MSIHKRKAIVCKNGHVAKSALKLNEDYSESYCVICGSELLFRCSSCGNFIDGVPYYDNVVTLGFDFNPPKNCYKCGKPFPWKRSLYNIKRMKIKVNRFNISLYRGIIFLGSISTIIALIHEILFNWKISN